MEKINKMNHKALMELFERDFREAVERKNYDLERNAISLSTIFIPIDELLRRHSKNKIGKSLIDAANRKALQDLYTIFTRPKEECRERLEDLMEMKIVNGEMVFYKRTPLTTLTDVDIWNFEPDRGFQGLEMPFREEIQELFETTFNPANLLRQIGEGAKQILKELKNNEKNNIELNANPATVCTS